MERSFIVDAVLPPNKSFNDLRTGMLQEIEIKRIKNSMCNFPGWYELVDASSELCQQVALK